MSKCTADKAVLAYDAGWMRGLAVFQLISIPIFFFWRHNAVLEDNVKRDDAPDHFSAKEEEVALLEKLRKEAQEVERLRE